MTNKTKPYQEFGPPPEEFPGLSKGGEFREIPATEEFEIPSETALPKEMEAPAPEMVEPGTYHWMPPVKEKKKPLVNFGFMLLAACLVLALLVGPLKGSAVSAEESPAPRQEASLPETEDSGTEESIPQTDDSQEETSLVAEESGEPADESPVPEPQDSEVSEGPTPEETSTAESSEESSEESQAIQYMEPNCEAIVYAYYSEIQGILNFSDMDSVTKVTLEICDATYGDVVETRDITKEAVEDKIYYIPMFTTDPMYMLHQDEYNAAMTFPMSAEFHIIMEYQTETGTEEKVVTAVTTNENRSMIICKYDPDQNGPGSIFLEASDTEQEINVLVNQTDQVGPGSMSFRFFVDDKEITSPEYEVLRFDATYYDEEGETPIIYTDCMISMPADIVVDGTHKYTLYVTFYLKTYDKVVTYRYEEAF